MVIGGMLALSPFAAFADPPIPMFAAGSFLTYLYGLAGVVIIEAAVLRLVFDVRPFFTSLGDAAAAKSLSTVACGLAYPAIVSGVTFGLASLLGGRARQILLAIGTWTNTDQAFGGVLLWSILVWLVLSFPVAVAVEFKVLEKRWRARAQRTSSGLLRVAVISNAVCYLFLVGLSLLLWKDVVFE